MKQNEKWLDWAVELQSLAQAGLFYTKDPFDKERYARIREITAEMLSAKTGVSVEKVKDIFCTDTGYQTPKLDTRSALPPLAEEKNNREQVQMCFDTHAATHWETLVD